MVQYDATIASHLSWEQPKGSLLVMDVTAWLDDAVQRAREKYEAQRALEERLLQEEALKRKLGSQFCRDLFAWLENVEPSFNSRFGGHVLAVDRKSVGEGKRLEI